MSIPTTTAFLDGLAPSGPRTLPRGLILIVASLASAGAIFGTVILMASENQRQAGRMMIDTQKAGYLAVTASQFTHHQGKPRGF